MINEFSTNIDLDEDIKDEKQQPNKKWSYKIGSHNLIQLKSNQILKGLVPLEKFFIKMM